MPIYNEVVATSGVDRKTRYLLQVFEQPAYRRLLGTLYWKWSELTYPALKHIEKPFWHLHDARCKGKGCTWGYDSRTGQRVRVCGYIPLTNRQDLRHYELSVKARINYRQFETSPEIARRHGWKI